MILLLSNTALIMVSKTNCNYLLLLVVSLLVALPVQAEPLIDKLVKAAIERTSHHVRYDGSYYPITYPNGDVPGDVGVCTDVVIRSYRQLGIDLQQRVHEDMAGNFDEYPSRKIWGLLGTDRNIDHRRVPNLQTYFRRHGKQLRVSENPQNYLPGDIVTWMLPGNLPHIGIVTDKKADDGLTPLIVHNIGMGPKLENRLFSYNITGHYRYLPDH